MVSPSSRSIKPDARRSEFRNWWAGVKPVIDVQQLAADLGMERPQAGGRWLCPFHNDHRPDLSVGRDRFRCWACGKAGDALNLVCAMLGCEFHEAIRFVADFAGVPPPAFAAAATVRRRPRPRSMPSAPKDEGLPPLPLDRRVEIVTAACAEWHLGHGYGWQQEAFTYLQRRGIGPETVIAAGLGYSPDYDAASRWLRDRFPAEDLRGAGLLSDKGNLRTYRHRLLFPSWRWGKAYGLQTRNIKWTAKADGPKELLCGPVLLPFNVAALDEYPDTVYLAEGAIDALSALEMGIVGIGVPGVEGFRPNWTKLFTDVLKVVVAFDNDAAGQRGFEKVASLFASAGRAVSRLRLPDHVKDLNDYLCSPEPAGVPA